MAKASLYIVVWDIEDRTKVKSYRSRREAFDRFKELCATPGVIGAEMQKENGYVLHSWSAPQ